MHACRAMLVTCHHVAVFLFYRLTLQKWMVLIYWWARQYPVGDAEEEAKVSTATAIQVNMHH